MIVKIEISFEDYTPTGVADLLTALDDMLDGLVKMGVGCSMTWDGGKTTYNIADDDEEAAE